MKDISNCLKLFIRSSAYIRNSHFINHTRKMPDGIMDGFFSTVLELATYSGRNKGIFLKKKKNSKK